MKPYTNFLIMLTASFCIMYGVMFLNVDRPDHIYVSLTRTYMSLLMVAPMAILMILMMGKMYPFRRLNACIIGTCVLVFVLALAGLRTQTPIGDRQYMQAMIPHHSSAIMTSRHANLQDPELKRLADGIIESQEREIRQMKMMLKRMK